MAERHGMGEIQLKKEDQELLASIENLLNGHMQSSRGKTNEQTGGITADAAHSETAQARASARPSDGVSSRTSRSAEYIYDSAEHARAHGDDVATDDGSARLTASLPSGDMTLFSDVDLQHLLPADNRTPHAHPNHMSQSDRQPGGQARPPLAPLLAPAGGPAASLRRHARADDKNHVSFQDEIETSHRLRGSQGEQSAPPAWKPGTKASDDHTEKPDLAPASASLGSSTHGASAAEETRAETRDDLVTRALKSQLKELKRQHVQVS